MQKIHIAARHAGAIGQAFLFGIADSGGPAKRGARDDGAAADIARDERPALEASRSIAIAQSQLIPQKGDGRRGGFDDQRNVKRESDTAAAMLREDGLDQWWPDPSLLPPQLPAGASMAELLHAVPVHGTAWLAFANAGVTEMLMNCALRDPRASASLLGWLSRYTTTNCSACCVHAVFPRTPQRRALPRSTRGTPFLFHRMGFLKARTIREVLLTGRHVLVSDSDVVRLRDPTAELLALANAGANIAPSTDCINVENDRDKTLQGTVVLSMATRSATRTVQYSTRASSSLPPLRQRLHSVRRGRIGRSICRLHNGGRMTVASSTSF